jgi:uncharacterized membrane-anchored protein
MITTTPSAKSLQSVLQRAETEGLLPPGANAPVPSSERPWPIIAVTALGAWLAILPFLGFLGLAFGDFLMKGPGGYVLGPLLMGLAVVLLRSKGLPLFVEQLAVPLLVTGAVALGFSLYRQTSVPVVMGAYALLAVGLAALIRATWLQGVMGAVAAATSSVGFLWWGGERLFRSQGLSLVLWVGLGLVVVWLVLQAWLRLSQPEPRTAQTVGAFASGWVVMALGAIVQASGQTFLLSGALGGGVGAELRDAALGTAQGHTMLGVSATAVASVVATAAALVWVFKRWPSLRQGTMQAPAWVVGLLLLGLALVMPTLGAALLVASMAATQRDWRIATLACIVALWVVGAFYYQLQWPLAHKALMMAVAGAVLGAATWMALRAGQQGNSDNNASAPSKGRATHASSAASPWAATAIALSVVACLAIANYSIHDKEQLIAKGQPVYVRLTPADPRSLMQGDFMRLAPARLPDDIRSSARDRGAPNQQKTWGEKPLVVAKINAERVAVLDRQAKGRDEPLASNELLIELTNKDGRWVIASDAWFFREGEAERWALARFAEYRITKDGRALLVNLRGEKLEPL